MALINGKNVEMVEQPRADKWWGVLPIIQKMQNADGNAMLAALDWPDVVKLVQASVASWEFDGDPQDPEAIGALHPFLEVVPILGLLGSNMAGWTATEKN